MNKNQKTWIRLILLMSSIAATFLGLQMFILVDLQKYQELNNLVLEQTNKVIIADIDDVPPLIVTMVTSEPLQTEVLPIVSPTVEVSPTVQPSPTTQTEVQPSPTAQTAVVASAPNVVITQNQTPIATPQTILPPVAVLDAQTVAAVQETTTQTNGQYVDGTYLGDPIQTDRWGTTQVEATISNGQLIDIEVIQYPNHTDRSARISLGALPTLISEAIQNQSADVDMVTRATDTSRAFIRSLSSALDDAALSS